MENNIHKDYDFVNELQGALDKMAKDFENIIEPISDDDLYKDDIKQPSHYKLNGLDIESIDVIKAVLGKDGFKSFCIGNCLKYLIRAEKKNGKEDYRKCKVYLDWILEG